MRRAGYQESEIAECLSFLREQNYVDDEQFAREFAASTAEHKYWGPARIAQSLRERGLSQLQIDAAIESAFVGGEKVRAERALLRFRRGHSQKGSTMARRARAYRHLIGRGYSPELAYETVTEAIESGFEQPDRGNLRQPTDH